MDGDVVSGMCVGLVALLSYAELRWTLPRPPQLTRPRASAECKCPYCHQAIDDGSARVRCRFCGTRHHEQCWTEHRGCSVFGCGSLEQAPAPARPAPVARVDVAGAPAGFEAVEEAPIPDLTVEPAPAPAPADPVG
jgi:hypothetical protein